MPETTSLLGGVGINEQRKILGHPLKDWITLAVLTVVTAVLLAILIAVLPAAAEVHPCTQTAELLITRVGREDQSKAYTRLEHLTETFGNRKSGSTALEAAIDWIVEEMKHDNLTATKVPVGVPKWSRGREVAALVLPTGSESPLRIMGLVGTVGANFTAPFIVVDSFEQLQHVQNVNGKIVVFNQPWTDNLTSLDVARNGAVEAAKVGAAGCLIRSPTPFSLATMHVATVQYIAGVNRIPCATITAEDAANLDGIYRDNRNINIKLHIDAHVETNSTSHNIVVEIQGTDPAKKGEFVVIGAHLDTLDLGHGVQNSLAGFIMAWEGFRVYKLYGMAPARSMRLVGWTGSEVGHYGSMEFAAQYNQDSVFVFDANRGPSTIFGVEVTAYGDDGYERIQEIINMMDLVSKAGEVVKRDTQPNSDISSMLFYGVPGATFQTQQGNNEYYWYSNSEADTILTVTPEELRAGGGIMAAYSFCVAQMEKVVPKRGVLP